MTAAVDVDLTKMLARERHKIHLVGVAGSGVVEPRNPDGRIAEPDNLDLIGKDSYSAAAERRAKRLRSVAATRVVVITEDAVYHLELQGRQELERVVSWQKELAAVLPPILTAGADWHVAKGDDGAGSPLAGW